MTIGLHTPATLSNAPTSKALLEDLTQDRFVARWLVTLEGEPSEEPSLNNELGESYVAKVKWNGEHVLLHCTNVEEHKHLTNHFNEQLNAKIFDLFKDILVT